MTLTNLRLCGVPAQLLLLSLLAAGGCALSQQVLCCPSATPTLAGPLAGCGGDPTAAAPCDCAAQGVPCYGYHPTQWTRWPEWCEHPPLPDEPLEAVLPLPLAPQSPEEVPREQSRPDLPPNDRPRLGEAPADPRPESAPAPAADAENDTPAVPKTPAAEALPAPIAGPRRAVAVLAATAASAPPLSAAGPLAVLANYRHAKQAVLP